MIEALSYLVSTNQFQSSKHLPAWGRVCSLRKPSV